VNEATSPRWVRRWLSWRALRLHLALLVIEAGCATATWWQVGVARSGDDIGWVYSVMWPGFAIFCCVVWWQLMHDERRVAREAQARTSKSKAQPKRSVSSRLDAIIEGEAADPALAAYNELLRRLAKGEATPAEWRRQKELKGGLPTVERNG
jgi:hypothetical protein